MSYPAKPLTVTDVINDFSKDTNFVKKIIIEKVSERRIKEGLDKSRLKRGNLHSEVSIDGMRNQGRNSQETKIIASENLKDVIRNLSNDIHTQCANCPHLKVDSLGYEDLIRDRSVFRLSAICGSANQPCPDEQTIFNMKTLGQEGDVDSFGFVRNLVKPKIEEKDIELEIMRLDKNYGLF